MNKDEKLTMAIDIGGSKLLVGILDNSGHILASRKSLFVDPTETSVIMQIKEECHKLMTDKYRPECVGISIPGLADTKRGIWMYACFSGIANLYLTDILSREFQIPCYLENDANICAYGEKIFGCARNVTDFIWITISNGVGAGIFINNQLYDGFYRNAGEIGHIKIVRDGWECPCGGHGCLEAMVAGNGISRRFYEMSGKRLSAKEIAELARGGHSQAQECMDITGKYIGEAIGTVQNILNLPLIVLGGGVAMSFDVLKEGIERGVRKNVFLKANPDYRIEPTALGYEASLIGAAAYALYRNKAI
ncbi:ROK family protein [Clostridiales bacterium COT073_COT-073]|nr:ROK family protein [Clostridiales bacterium COT073_COT-073]